MRKKNPNRLSTLEKRYLKRYTYLLYIFIPIFLVYSFFFEKKTIGLDIRYYLYIIFIPFLVGAIVNILFAKNFMIKNYASAKNASIKFLSIQLYILFIVFSSFLCFVEPTIIVWDILNNNKVKENYLEQYDCKIISINKRKYSSCSFLFNNKIETFSTHCYSKIKDIDMNHLSNYTITIVIRKGIWDSYIVEEWYIKEKIF